METKLKQLSEEIEEREDQLRKLKQSLDNEHLKVLAADKNDISLADEGTHDYLKQTLEE